MTNRKLANHITINAEQRDKFSFDIDGEEFPYYIGPNINVNVGNDEIPGITIFIPANSVQISHGHAADD